MNTTAAEAAATAGVTVATIRTWCRRNVIGAVKAGGRWVIDTASLAHRISLGAPRTKPAAPKPVVYSVETMTAIGGSAWIRGDKHRVYINGWTAYAGLEVDHYNTGNISSASYQGKAISNSQAYKLVGCIDKVWFDAADGKLHARFGLSESRVATRDEVWEAVVAGIRTAIAAL